MSNDRQDHSTPRKSLSGSERGLPYVRPRLERLGDIRSTILGRSPGGGDSPIGKIGT